jgi:hypothetical protein
MCYQGQLLVELVVLDFHHPVLHVVQNLVCAHGKNLHHPLHDVDIERQAPIFHFGKMGDVYVIQNRGVKQVGEAAMYKFEELVQELNKSKGQTDTGKVIKCLFETMTIRQSVIAIC